MDTRLLRIFSAVAKHGALPSASRELHLTASALSHALKTLESQLGARLFDRVGKRLILNHAGEQLLDQIAEPMEALERAAASIKALGKWGQGRIRVGAPESVCQQILPKTLRELRRGFAKLFVLVECGETTRLLDLLRQDQLDLVLGVEPERVPELEVKPWFQDELLFAFASEHPWSDGRPLTTEEVSRQPIISYQRTSLTSQRIERFFGEQQVELSVTMEVRNIATMTRLVALNLGAAILPPWVFGRDLTTGVVKMRPLGARALKRRWSIMHRAERRLSLAEEELIKLCRHRPAELRLDRKDLPEAARIAPRP